MKQEGLLSNFIVFCHRNSIADQWQKSAELINLNVRNLEKDSNLKYIFSEADGWIISYQSASRNLKIFKKELSKVSSRHLLAIADEAHHLGVSPEEPEGPVWGKTFLELTQTSKLRLGLTGTPFRSDNLAFCSARKVQIQSQGELIEQITPDLCVEPLELINAGDVRPLVFNFQDGWVDHSHEGHPDRERSLLSSETREGWRARNLRRSIKISDSSSIAVQLLAKATKKLEEVRFEHQDAGGLIISKDIEHAKAIGNLLKENGEKVLIAHSQDQEANANLISFKKNQASWLVSVDMCSEGFDSPRIRVVAYLTTIVSESRFLQSITRSVRISASRAFLEPIPRRPSHIFAPADPLLMEYARNWSKAKPYLIKGKESLTEIDSSSCSSRSPTLPMEAVEDTAGEVIKMRTAELPQFLKG